MSCTRSLLKPYLLSSPVGTRVHNLAQPCRELRVGDSDDRRGILSDRLPQLDRAGSFGKPDALRGEHRNDLLQAVVRRIERDHGILQLATERGASHLLHSDDGEPSARAESHQRERAAPLGALDLHAPAPSPAAASVRPASSLPPSSVSSSMIAITRSASAGAMPGRRRKSSRSRSMMSFSVRYPPSSSTATVAAGRPSISESFTSAASSLSSGSGAKIG